MPDNHVLSTSFDIHLIDKGLQHSLYIIDHKFFALTLKLTVKIRSLFFKMAFYFISKCFAKFRMIIELMANSAGNNTRGDTKATRKFTD